MSRLSWRRPQRPTTPKSRSRRRPDRPALRRGHSRQRSRRPRRRHHLRQPARRRRLLHRHSNRLKARSRNTQQPRRREQPRSTRRLLLLRRRGPLMSAGQVVRADRGVVRIGRTTAVRVDLRRSNRPRSSSSKRHRRPRHRPHSSRAGHRRARPRSGATTGVMAAVGRQAPRPHSRSTARAGLLTRSNNSSNPAAPPRFSSRRAPA
jgi:hypothetical protein